MKMDTLELLRDLSGKFGVSGFEGDVRDWIAGQIRPVADGRNHRGTSRKI
jgi:putative aminopeptidase FrvX